MKIQTLDELDKARVGKKIVLVNGNFNILHPGHIRFLNFASMCGDFLVVAVNSDESDGVFIGENVRLNSLKSLKNIDYAFILREDYLNFIEKLKPDLIVKGQEYSTAENIEDNYIKRSNAKLIFSSGDAEGSIYHDQMSFDVDGYECLEYLNRNKISKNNLRKIINNFEGKNVVVVGDVIVDEYIECDAIGMSQEDPTIVVRPLSQTTFIGGAGIVAYHLENLGANCFFFTVGGKDVLAEFVNASMKQSKVFSKIYYDESRVTVHKKRYRVGNKTMLRVNEFRSHDLSHEISDALFGDIEKIIHKIDLLIFSDFNYGCLPQYLVNKLIELCKKNRIPFFADSQSSSQTGDASRFKGGSFVALTEREARLALHDMTSGLVVLAEKICRKSHSNYCLLKVGADGLLIHIKKSNKLNTKNIDQIPALNNAPVDVAGAGDSLLAAASLAMQSGATIWEAAYIGSVMAAIQVGRVGNVPITRDELLRKI